MNIILLLLVLAAFSFIVIIAYDPHAADWLASVIYARACAVRAPRVVYNNSRARILQVGPDRESLRRRAILWVNENDKKAV